MSTMMGGGEGGLGGDGGMLSRSPVTAGLTGLTCSGLRGVSGVVCIGDSKPIGSPLGVGE